MRRDDILLNELYSKVCNKEVVNEDLKGIFNTAKEKMSSFFNNDKPENTELKKILNQINELKLTLMTNGYEPKEFLNFDKIKTLSGGSVSSNSQTSSQVSNVEPQTPTQAEPEDDSRFATRSNTTPSTQSSNPQTANQKRKPFSTEEFRKKDPYWISDIEQYSRQKEKGLEDQRIEDYKKIASGNGNNRIEINRAKAYLNKLARDNNQPIPHPEILPKKPEVSVDSSKSASTVTSKRPATKKTPTKKTTKKV
jgi:hypothetical protein